jgi:protocatechuate 3,4-dioxygenase, beta subunit
VALALVEDKVMAGILISRRGVVAGAGALVLAAGAHGANAATPAEIEGPFFPVDTKIENDADLTRLAGRNARAAGQVMELSGRVLDANGKPIGGARLELWQANAAGRYAHPGDAGNTAPLDPNFQGYALLLTGADGSFRVTTIKPAGYNVPGFGLRTPHLHWKVAHGPRTLTTQSYFPNEPQNDTDGLMRRMGAPVRDLIARAAPAAEPRALGFVWDIVLPA